MSKSIEKYSDRITVTFKKPESRVSVSVTVSVDDLHRRSANELKEHAVQESRMRAKLALELAERRLESIEQDW